MFADKLWISETEHWVTIAKKKGATTRSYKDDKQTAHQNLNLS